MYSMKNIITHDGDILLSKCMYHMKNLYNFETTAETTEEEIDINVKDQVMKLLKTPSKEMAALEIRQDQLLKKLDILYDRIKTISSFCNVNSTKHSSNARNNKTALVEIPEEVVLVYSPDCLPLFLKKIIKDTTHPLNVSWHIHSSVPSEKVPRIQAFVKSFPKLQNSSKVNIRLIFKNADPELKLSSLDLPIVGNVNVLRYISLAYPSVIPYDFENYDIDNLLDTCHLLERTTEKSKEALTKKLFSQSKNWIYNDEFSIVDAAAYNVIKQWQNSAKYAPKDWLAKCDKLF